MVDVIIVQRIVFIQQLFGNLIEMPVGSIS